MLKFVWLYFRNLKKSELQLKVASDALEQVKLVFAKVKSQLDIAPKDDGTLFQKRKELQKEVDLAKKTLAQQVRKCLFYFINHLYCKSFHCKISFVQNGYTSHERARVEQMILEQENLLRDQSNLRLDVVDLKRLAAIKVKVSFIWLPRCQIPTWILYRNHTNPTQELHVDLTS